jgi:carboxymethylenebutenolidase
MLISSASLFAAEDIERTITVSAAPLQAWKAMSMDWQVMQWSGANSTFFEPQPTGAWRITYPDGRLEEGIFSEVVPPEKLVYSYIHDGVTTNVTANFIRVPEGTTINIRHSDFPTGRAGNTLHEEVAAMWDRQLPKLSEYLDRIPGSYLTKPYGDGPFPAMLVLHDRFGLNRATREFCDSLAANGYVALAVDMFKGDATSDSAQAARYLTLVDNQESVSAALNGLDYLMSRREVKSDRIGVFGAGYGATVAYYLAAETTKLQAIVTWYGNGLPDQTYLQRITAPVYSVFLGDPDMPPPDAEIFSQSMIQAGVKAETVLVTGAPGFADPAYGAAYNTTAFAEAWARSLNYLDQRMKI